MANKFIVCDPCVVNESNLAADACADCGAAIVVDAARQPGYVYICQKCLPERMDRDEPDEVEVTIGQEAPPPAEETTQADLKKCREATDATCGCKVCQKVTPIADALAGALRGFKDSSKVDKVEAIIRVLAEVAVAYQGGGLWHRDATYVGALAQARLSIVADREYMAEIERVRPILEKAMAEAGIDLQNLIKPLPKETTH